MRRTKLAVIAIGVVLAGGLAAFLAARSDGPEAVAHGKAPDLIHGPEPTLMGAVGHLPKGVFYVGTASGWANFFASDAETPAEQLVMTARATNLRNVRGAPTIKTETDLVGSQRHLAVLFEFGAEQIEHRSAFDIEVTVMDREGNATTRAMTVDRN